MEAVRRWLGSDTINVYGSSYTSRLAMVYARRYPKRVRTMTVKAVTPFAIRNPLQVARASQDALDRVFADCAAEQACNASYPKLREQFETVLARLTAAPPTVGSTLLTRDVFAGVIRRLLYAAESQRVIPLVIASAARGDYAPLKPVLGAGDAIDRVLNLGLFLSVTCAEDVARYSREDIANATRGTFTGGVLATALKDACEEWPAAKLRRDAESPVRGVRSLIISGALDPDTPPVWGREVARLFPGATHLEIAGIAHSGSPSCVRAVVTQFIAKGTMDDVDTACVAQLKRQAFVNAER